MDGDKMVKLIVDITLGRKINSSKMNEEDQRKVAELIKQIEDAKEKGQIIEVPDDMP